MPYRYYPPPYPIPRMPYPPLPTPPIVTPAIAPSKIEQFLQSTGQFMKTAQTYAPYVQQAMPMIKSLPALISLYKGFQDSPTVEDRPKRQPKKANYAPERTPIKSKPSLPKIYQP